MSGKIKLGDTATFVNGYPFKPETWTEEGLPIIRIQNLNNPDAAFNRFSGTIPEKYIVRKGDILISWSASLGAYEWSGEDAYLNQHIFKVVFNKCPIDKHFLRYAVESKLAEMEKDAHGATMRHIVKKDFDNTPIPYPPVQEQEKIVAELDCLSGIIEKKKQQLKELDNLAQSIFYDMFGDPITNEKGWEVKLVREIASVKIGPFGSLLHAADYITGGCPVINTVHMREGRICAEADFTVSEEKRNEMSSYLLERNDIIFGRRGDIGRCALVSATEAGYICGTGSLFVRFTAPIIPIFALSVFMSNEMKDLLVRQAKGATMLNINCGIVEQVPVILPPLDIQNKFAQKIEAIEKEKELVKQSIAEAETLFNSRMDYWFN